MYCISVLYSKENNYVVNLLLGKRKKIEGGEEFVIRFYRRGIFFSYLCIRILYIRKFNLFSYKRNNVIKI